MRLLHIELENYIGIYNGTGKRKIAFNFENAKRIIAIRGMNGSGKSTLLKALNPFPDPLSAIIPGVAGRKTLVYEASGNIYVITINYPIKPNGERATTQCSIIQNGIEINPSLNVSSAKDFIMSEFELDNNFITLSQLSSEDRGLADKRPAERKKFINDILSDLTVYNNMHKVLSKKSSNLKNLVNVIASKIDNLSCGTSLKSMQETCTQAENSLNNWKRGRDLVLKELGSLESETTALNVAEKKYREITTELSFVNNYNLGNDFKKDIIRERLNNIMAKLAETKVTGSSLNDIIDNIKSSIATKEKELAEINNKLLSFDCKELTTSEDFFASFEAQKQKLNELKEKLEPAIINSDITIEFIDYMIMMLLDVYNEGKTKLMVILDEDVDYLDDYQTDLENVHIVIDELNIKRNKASNALAKYTTLDDFILNKVPVECKVKDCYFRKLAEDQASTNRQIELLKREIADIDSQIRTLKDKAERDEIIIENQRILSKFNTLIMKNITKHNNLVNMFNLDYDENFTLLYTPNLIFNKVIVKPLQYIRRVIDSYDILRDIFNTKKEYEHLSKVYAESVLLYDRLKDKEQEIKEIINNQKETSNKVVELKKSLDEKKNLLMLNRSTIDKLESDKAMYKKAYEEVQRYEDLTSQAMNIKTILDNGSKIIERQEDLKQKLIAFNQDIKNGEEDIKTLEHRIRAVTEYMREYKIYNENYQKIETVKKYVSPTTGIQTLFMETYMNNILIVANQLLAHMFEGQFVLQPFVINESEFRIPCAGPGFLNDDISSMSTSQICIISMIISFAMLYNSSSKYNIIKLDEIDGGLDVNNRLRFISMLYEVMNIMNCEQCFIISHNAEINEDQISIIIME